MVLKKIFRIGGMGGQNLLGLINVASAGQGWIQDGRIADGSQTSLIHGGGANQNGNAGFSAGLNHFPDIFPKISGGEGATGVIRIDARVSHHDFHEGGVGGGRGMEDLV